MPHILSMIIASLTSLTTPMVISDPEKGPYIRFFYPKDQTVRSVNLRLSIDGYKTARPMSMGEHKGEYVFFVNVPMLEAEHFFRATKQSVIEYFFLVDGVATHDPSSTRKKRQKSKKIISTYTVSRPVYDWRYSPSLYQDGEAVFIYFGKPLHPPVVSGSFNNWHPKEYKMKHVKTNRWVFHLSLPPGDYSYQLIIDGERILDPLNPKVAHAQFPKPAQSIFSIP